MPLTLGGDLNFQATQCIRVNSLVPVNQIVEATPQKGQLSICHVKGMEGIIITLIK